jgi:cell filamentation protein
MNAIHPFREGNGRTLRLFLDLLAGNAGYEPVDFTQVPDEKYIEACRRGMIQEYEQMEKLYSSLLGKIAKK